jgi:4-amino-4-deoxy-L-arabinose transferase-like glycosyltransferase
MRFDSRETRRALVLITSLALSVRLLAFPFATTDEGDSVWRTWIAWRWLSEPKLITYGVWGPLHTYLIALSMAIGRDPVIPPVLLQILFSAPTAFLLYLFMRREFAGSRVSLFIAIAYVFYPMAMSTSLTITAEAPFNFFLVLVLFLLSLARQEQGSWKHALGAGIALTLAGMLRYEGWMLIPLLGVLLWKKPGFMMIFVMSSLIHPVFWMIGNALHFGDPLYSITWASNWEINIVGSRDDLNIYKVIFRFFFYPIMTVLGMTPIVGIACLVGAVLAVKRRRKYAVWLIPFLGLSCLLMISAAQGSLGLTPRYTLTLGTLLFPFLAELYGDLGILDYPIRKRLLAELLIVASMIVFSYPEIFKWSRLPPFSYFPLSRAIPMVKPYKATKAVSVAVNGLLKDKNEGFICDFFGWDRSYYVALMTRLYPRNIFVAPGDLHDPLDLKRLSDVVTNHQSGVLLLQRGSRFARFLEFRNSPDQVKIGNTLLRVETAHSMILAHSEIVIYRYRVIKGR